MKRAVTRGVTCFGAPLALILAAGCGMDAEEGMTMDDDPGLDQANPDGSEEGLTGESGAPAEAPPEEVGDTGQDDVGEDVDAVMGLSFEDYDIGPVASPWSIGRSLTTRASIERTSDHGNVFLLQGSPTSGDFLLASLDMQVPSDVEASVDIKPSGNAAFVWSVNGTGVSTYKRRIRLQRWVGSNRLIASASPSGDTDCGSMPADAWTKLTMVVHTATTPSTFDVLINGNPTACTNLQAYVTKPFNMVQIMDSSSLNWGGNVRFDNIVVSAP